MIILNPNITNIHFSIPKEIQEVFMNKFEFL
jgi:hypothetical protein